MGLGNAVNQANTDGRVYWDQVEGRILVKDSSLINRLVMGNLPDGTIGFVISKEGVDVLNVFD